MALDFPANPVDGQAYGAYIYNASVGAWQAKEDPATVATVSAVAPASGNPGDIWYDSDDGTTYIYYDDGNSGQWVELLSSGVPLLNTKADLAGATFTGNVTAPRFISNIATGTSPLQVTSTTAVTNLNADLLDGQHGSVYSPTGAIMQFAGATAPTGWLFCQGQELQITSYQTLYNTLTANGTTFPYGANTNGSGAAGTTHFRLPNLQNKVPVGLGTEAEFNALGETGGAKTVALTESEIPSHTHTTPNHSHTFSGTTSTDGSHAHTAYGALIPRGTGAQFRELTEAANGSNNVATSSAGSHSHTYSGTTSNASPTTNATGGGLAHNNLQPYIVLNYIIKT